MRGTPIDDLFAGDRIAVSMCDDTLIGDYLGCDRWHGHDCLLLRRVQAGRLDVRKIPLFEIKGVFRQRRGRASMTVHEEVRAER